MPFPIAVPPLDITIRGKPIYAAALRFIRPGTTTKTDVVWEFGAPDSKGVERFGERSEVKSQLENLLAEPDSGVLGKSVDRCGFLLVSFARRARAALRRRLIPAQP